MVAGRRSRRTIALVAGLAAFLQGLLFWIDRYPRPRLLWGDETMYAEIAMRLAAGGSATTEMLWPPLYPQVLAALIVLAHGSLALVPVFQLGLLVASAILLRDVTCRVTGAPLAGDVAGALMLLDPQMSAFAHYLWPECLHLALFLVALWILLARSHRPWWLVVLGLALGLALLTKSLLVPFVPILLMPLAWQDGWRHGLPRVALVLAVTLTTIAPTVVANGRRGSYTVADSSRFNLWVGLNDGSRKDLVDEITGREYGRYLESAPDFQGRNRVLEAKILSLWRERGAVSLLLAQLDRQYFRLFDKDSFLTDQLPGGAISRRGYGYQGTPSLLATSLRVWSHALVAFVLVTASFGLALERAPGPWLRVLALFLAYNLVLFLFLHVKSRYRVAFLPVLFLYAGSFVARAWTVHPTALGGRMAWIGGAILATISLLLAFARPWLD